jgi:hypothetical protein
VAPREVDLSRESIEALATRLADLIGGASPKPAGRGEGEMITAAEVSRRWGISRRWVYGHAGALGAMRLGGGPRPRLRFDPAEVADRLGAPAVGPGPVRPDMRRSTGSPGGGGSDSLSPPARAMFVESQVAAGGRPDAPGPAPEEAPRRAPGHSHGARLRPPPTDPDEEVQ